MIQRDMLESDALASFAVFAAHRNFTVAAAVLNISQPSLHVKIGKLSTALGLELYERAGLQLVLTDAGERLAAYAADSSRRLDEFLAQLQGSAPAITLAAGRGTFRWVITDAIRQIGADGRRVNVITADREAALDALTAGRADVAIVGYDAPPRSVESVQIASYPQVLVMEATHELAGRARLRLADLTGLGLVVPPPARPHRKALERALLDAGIAWHPAAEVDGWDLMVHFTALGIGPAVVNGCVEVADGLVAVPVSGLPVVRYWAAWRKQRPPEPDVLRHLRQR